MGKVTGPVTATTEDDGMNAKTVRTQDDLIFVTERFSIWRDKYQWFLYDFHGSRLDKKGDPRKPPRPTYHPKLSQLIDSMVENVMREEAENLRHVETLVNTHKYQIFDYMQTILQPWGKTAADECEKEGESLFK